jgi:hypothetical protein
MKSLYDTLVWSTWRLDMIFHSMIITSSMTSQSARFL